jgi:hypothetical protein
VAPEQFVPVDFDVPTMVAFDGIRLEPLGPEHNEDDFAAWTGSIEHIQSTPGFPWGSWPAPMTPDANRRDLEEHAEDFRLRRGFTYTVLDPTDRVIGCVYIYPWRGEPARARVRSWVRADRSHLDRPLYLAVSGWLNREWPFVQVDYADRVPVG